MIVIVDYGMGNLRSVQKAFEMEGARAVVSDQPKTVENAGKLVLPGVGAFGHAMAELKKRKLIEPLKDKIAGGTPYLGLCLGLQLLFSRSQEGGRTKGLGIIAGEVRRFKGRMKIPHIGWNGVAFKKKDCPLFKALKENVYFYFVHSYFGVPEDPDWVAGVTRYGGSFCSAVWKGGIFATQFHPEKSQSAGLRVIKNFIDSP